MSKEIRKLSILELFGLFEGLAPKRGASIAIFGASLVVEMSFYAGLATSKMFHLGGEVIIDNNISTCSYNRGREEARHSIINKYYQQIFQWCNAEESSYGQW